MPAKTEQALLLALVERVAACHGKEAFWTEAEVAQWPEAFMANLEPHKLLTSASPASEVICDGCEQRCFMPVEMKRGANPRALIWCDQRDDIAMVPVRLESLNRRKVTGQALASALAELVGLDADRVQKLGDGTWQLGQYKGLKHKSPLIFTALGEPLLALAGHTIKLVEAIEFKKGAVVVDVLALRKAVDNPTGSGNGTHETPQQRAQRFRKRIGELKAQGVRAFRAQLAKEEGIDVSRVSQIIRIKRDNEQSTDPFSVLRATKYPFR